MLEYFAGTATVARRFRARGWTTITVDRDPATRPDIVADLATWAWRGPAPDFVWASPPCTSFTLAHYLRGSEPTGADWELVQLTRRRIIALRPTYWALENVKGLVRYWPEYRLALGPWFLWGHFPLFSVRTDVAKHADQVRNPIHRATIPVALVDALLDAIEAQPQLWED